MGCLLELLEKVLFKQSDKCASLKVEGKEKAGNEHVRLLKVLMVFTAIKVYCEEVKGETEKQESCYQGNLK